MLGTLVAAVMVLTLATSANAQTNPQPINKAMLPKAGGVVMSDPSETPSPTKEELRKEVEEGEAVVVSEGELYTHYRRQQTVMTAGDVTVIRITTPEQRAESEADPDAFLRKIDAIASLAALRRSHAAAKQELAELSARLAADNTMTEEQRKDERIYLLYLRHSRIPHLERQIVEEINKK